MFSKVRKGLVVIITSCIFILMCLSSDNYWIYPVRKSIIGYSPAEVNTEETFYSRIDDTRKEISPTSMRNTAASKEETQPDFSFMQTMLLFIGYPRSGSTLLGSLLDAHPAMVVANEYNLVFKLKNFTSNKKTREDVFSELYKNSVLEASKEQRAANKKYFFHYHVPGLWQGKTKGPLKVIGDKKSSATTRALESTKVHNSFEELSRLVKLPIKFIHLIRNPYDNIATMALRAAHPGSRMKAQKLENYKLDNRQVLEHQTNIYFSLIDKNINLRKRFGDNVLDVHYSYFVRKPKRHLKRLCAFLDVTCTTDYIDACRKIVFKNETYTRRHVVWDDELKQRIADKIKSVEFLENYTYDIL